MCDVLTCNKNASCELYIEGDWLPICDQHAKNKFLPRRPLPPNSKVSDAPDSAAPNRE